MKNKKLNITFLDFDDIKNPLLGAGQANVTMEVGSRLVKNGHQVTVVSSKYPGYKDRKENGILYKHIGIKTKNIKINNTVYILSIPFVAPFIKSDIIIECFISPISTLFSPLFTSIPIVGLSTCFDAERFSKKYHLPFWIIEKFGCRFYKYFIALTPNLAKKMQAYNLKTITKIIPNGVSNEYFSIKNKEPEFILFIGRLDMNQKGLDLLLESFAKVTKQIPYPLVIAGDGPDKEKVKQLIKKLGISKDVKLVGFANQEKKVKLFSKAAFIAFPSRSEGFPLVPLETIASGHRFLAFDIPSLEWANSQVAKKIKPFNKTSYSKYLITESKQAKNKATENVCRDFAKKYTWEKVTNKFENFFYQVIKETI